MLYDKSKSGSWTSKRCSSCLTTRTMPEGDRICGLCRFPTPKKHKANGRLLLGNLRAVREEAGVSIRMISEQVGVSGPTLFSYETGVYRCSPPMATAIGEVLGVGVRDLEGGGGAP